MIWRWTTKTTDTHSAYQYLLLFRDNNGYVNARESYVLRTLPVLLLQDFGDSDVYGTIINYIFLEKSGVGCGLWFSSFRMILVPLKRRDH